MSYQQEYQRWLRSGALSQAEKAELEAIAQEPQEIEDRFFGLLEFGTAGLRGVMGVGLRRMNVHVIRHATQAFAQVILAEGPEAAAQGVAICYDCRVHSQEFAQAAAGVMAANGIPVRSSPLPCGSTAASPGSTSPPATTRRSTTATRCIGPTGPSFPPNTLPPSPSRWSSWTCLTACVPWTTSRPWTRA